MRLFDFAIGFGAISNDVGPVKNFL